MLRSIVAAMFAMLAGTSAWAAACDGFTDVDSSSQFCAAVGYIKDHGITLGCTGTTYCPNDFVTRLQMAAFLQRAGQADPTNVLGGHTTTIGGGTNNTATGDHSVVAGGLGNSALATYSAILGGFDHEAVGFASAIVGGQFNGTSGANSVVLNGEANIASGQDSLVAGLSGRSDQSLCAVFSLWSSPVSGQSCIGQSNILKVGGQHGFSVDYHAETGGGGGDRWVAIGDTVSLQTISTWTGAFLSDGGTWTNFSDRDAKTDVIAVNSRSVLDKVASMPMETWRYKSEASQRHLGPMAQDFYAAFGLGADDKHITTIDEGGVALAVIQGLNAKVDARDAMIAEQAEELAALAARLAVLEHQGVVSVPH